jgi:hypothetical protein
MARKFVVVDERLSTPPHTLRVIANTLTPGQALAPITADPAIFSPAL